MSNFIIPGLLSGKHQSGLSCNHKWHKCSNYNGRYSGLLLSGQNRAQVERSHDWYVCVLANRQPISPIFEFRTDPMFADNPPRCGDTSDGSQPGCIMDPCRHPNAIQVKIVNWQKLYSAVPNLAAACQTGPVLSAINQNSWYETCLLRERRFKLVQS